MVFYFFLLFSDLTAGGAPPQLLQFGKLQSFGIKPCLSEGSYQVNSH
jgi:hypothetical protein